MPQLWSAFISAKHTDSKLITKPNLPPFIIQLKFKPKKMAKKLAIHSLSRNF